MTTSTNGSPAERIAALTAVAEGGLAQGAILAALEDATPAVRDWAIRLATRYVEPAVLGQLVADDANAVLRNAAITALERQGPYAVPHLQAMLREGNAEVVMFALQVLTRIGDPTACAAIIPLLAHADPNVAQSAVEALGRLRHAAAAPALVALLDGDLWLQLAAVGALGEIGAPEAVEPLLALVPDSFVAEAAVRALQQIAAPESLGPLLERLLDDRERGLRDAVLEAVGVVLDLHPEPETVALPFGAELRRRPETQSLLTYLAELVGAADAGRGEALVRAAGTLTVAARLTPLLPIVLRRTEDPEELAWIEPVFRRHGRGLTAELKTLLGHGEAAVRAGVLLVGTFDADDLPLVVEHLREPDPRVRAAACSALGVLRATSAVPLLVDHLAGGEAPEQAAAVAALARMPAEALDELEPCFAPDVPETVQTLALQVVARSRHARFEPKVLKLCRARSAAVRLAALRAAAQLPGSRTEVALIRALADSDERVRVEALASAVQRGGATTVTTLTALLSAADSLRYHVIRALGQLGAASAAPRLVTLYEECQLHERLEVLAALGRIGAAAPLGASAVALVTRCIASSEPEIRRAAARALADTAGADEAAVLVGLARDPDWALRAEAARGLGRLAAPGARDTLLVLVRDVEPVVAAVARAGLTGQGVGTAPAAA